ncbi:MAG: sodium:calcium antiporter [bacterium]
MTLLFYLIVFVICLIVVIKSGTLLVKSLITISRFLHWSEYSIAFILMAFATSVPELFIGVTSAIRKVPSISFGNIIGANILNLTLAIGMVIIIARGIDVSDQSARKDAWLIFFMALLPILLSFDGVLSRIDGVILLLLFIWYATRLLGRKEKFNEKINLVKYDVDSVKKTIKSLFLFIIGLSFLLIAAWGLVWSATAVATRIGFSLALIGLILVAIGTTLPEMSFGVRSVLLKHEEMAIGNFVGSVAFNSLIVIGLVAVICPFEVDFHLAIISALFLSLSLIVFNIFIHTKKRLSYREGVILLMMYGLFLVSTMFLK